MAAEQRQLQDNEAIENRDAAQCRRSMDAKMPGID
jgi:hypothetical protein